MSTTTLLYRFMGLDAGAGAEFDRMAGKTAMLGKSSSTALLAIKQLALGSAAVGAVVAVESVKMAAGFQTSMLRIQTQANDSAKHVAQLSHGVLAMAGSVATTPSVLADAAYHIASVGQGALNTAQQLRVLKIAAEGAKIGGANLTDVTNALDGAIVSGIKGAKDYSKAMGVLNSTVGAGDMSMQDLADAIGTGVTVTAKQAGVSLKQLGAALAVYGDNNIRGARAGTQLRMAIQSLEVPASTATDTFATWHLKMNAFAKDMQHGGLPLALADLKKHMIAAGETGDKVGATLTTAFGKKAGAGISNLVGEYTRFGNKMTEVGKGATGFAASWDTYNKSFQAGLDGARAAGEALLITLGTKLLPAATQLMNWIRTAAIPALQGLMSGFSGGGKSADGLGSSLRGLAQFIAKNVMPVVRQLVTVEFADLRSMVRSVTGTIRSHQAQLSELASFVRKVLVPVFKVYLWEAFLQIKVAFRVMVDVISAGVTVFNGLRKAAMAVGGFFSGPFLRVMGSMVNVVVQAFKFMSDAAISFVSTFTHSASQAFGWVPFVGGKLKSADQAVQNFRSNVDGTLSGMAATARTWGRHIGDGIGQGLVFGLNSQQRAVATAAIALSNTAQTHFKMHAGMASPSKVFRQYGVWIVEGLVNGVKSYTARAGSVMKTLAHGLISGWQDGTGSLKSALATPVQNALSKLQTVVDNAIGKQQTSLKNAQTALRQLVQARNSAIASLSSTVAGGADLSNLFGTDAAGNPTTGNVGSFLSGQVAPLKAFAKDLKWAADHHLSPVLLSQIANLGAIQGDAVLKQFMSGQASIAAVNTSERMINRYAHSVASTAEDAVYAKRIAKDRKAVEDNSAALHRLTEALRGIERSTAKSAAVHLTIDAKTGKPHVDQKFIHDVIKGIKEANRTAGKDLLKS